jgi:hypothetical protein
MKNDIKVSSRHQGYSYYFAMMIEQDPDQDLGGEKTCESGSGSGSTRVTKSDGSATLVKDILVNEILLDCVQARILGETLVPRAVEA